MKKTIYIALMLLITAGFAQAQTTTFTYQGRFTDTTVQQPTNGTYTMTFRLYDAETGGTQIGADITSMVSVVNNLFTVKLNFGAAFATNGARYLEIQVGSTVLTTRQEITAAPFAVRAVNAASADSLSSACVGCVTNQQISSVAGTKITGNVANADSATTAQNVSGVVAIANGGTGSSTKNFVDTTTAQTVAGNKTFSNTVSASLFSAGSGGVAMNNNFLRLRGNTDNNHGMLWNSTIDGPEFRGNSGFLWTTGTNGANERMRLDGSGNLTVNGSLTANGNITTNGTINGTLANNSVGTAQVADGSLRVSDLAINNQLVALGTFTLGPQSCSTQQLNGGGAVGDLVTIYLANNTPAGFYVQPTIFTTAGSANISFCNTLNSANVFPAQNVRVVITRP